MNEKIETYFSSIESFEILLIVDISTTNLEKLAVDMASRYELTQLSLNKELSQILVSEPRQFYASKIIEWITTKSNGTEATVLFSNIDILFEPSLEIDPLMLFKKICRHRQIVVLWPGEFSNNNLIYATPDHAHFKRWANPGVEIIQL
jgi:hypothetical protein